MPPAFILSQDQTLHREKFERIPEGMPCSFYNFSRGGDSNRGIPERTRRRRHRIIQFIVTIALYFAAQLSRSLPPQLRRAITLAELHMFATRKEHFFNVFTFRCSVGSDTQEPLQVACRQQPPAAVGQAPRMASAARFFL